MAGDIAVYEFAFLTSRYSNFLHHIHSFQDAVWNHFTLLQDPDYEIDGTVLVQILANSEEDSVKFEQLMLLFDLNPRPLPDRVEMALMNDRHQSYGLLLESPEPFDWSRGGLKLLFAKRGNVRITRVCLMSIILAQLRSKLSQPVQQFYRNIEMGVDIVLGST